jgi:RNA polymerase sigma-70 factor (ECF subfamily)
VVQESLLRALQGLERFEERSEGGFRDWLARCVEHEIIRQARRALAAKRGRGEGRRLSELDTGFLAASVFSSGDPSPSQFAQASELAERLEAALLALPDHYRELIVLRQLCEMSYAEIARVFGYAQETTARMAFSRASQKLKAALGVG